MQTLTRRQVREIDQRAVSEFHVPSIVLMENAGRGAAELLIQRGCRGPVSILCGKGNNAGDGLVVARHLDIASIPVRVFCTDDPSNWRGDVAVNYAIVRTSGIAIDSWAERTGQGTLAQEFNASEWIVDALLGTGAIGPPRSPVDQWIREANRASAKRMALDIPSGMDCDTGEPYAPTFRADHTCTFVAEKVGFCSAAATPYLGQVHVIGIGAPRQSWPTSER